jgi:hypothetical protein
MAALIQSIIEALAQALLKQGVAGAGSLATIRALRMTCAAIIAAVATWVAVASAFLWTSARVPGVQGLVQYVLTAGGPIWELALPACAVVLALLLVLPVPGKFSLGWVLSAAVTALAMGALAEFQGVGHSALNGFAVFSMIPTWPMTLLSLGFAWGEVPPLDAPLSRLALKYYRRRKHLVALREYGRQRGLQISGPGGKGAALTMEGQYDAQHRVVITSSLQQATSGASTYKVNVRMSSPRDILALYPNVSAMLFNDALAYIEAQA